MVLVRYEDENIHRAICIEEKADGTFRFFLIDWGNYYTTTPNNIWKISKELAKVTVVSRTVKIAAKSGKSIENIDPEGTVFKLCEENCFQGFVEMTKGNKYLVIIDDSFLAFKD